MKPTIVQLESITVEFPGVRAVDNISLALKTGEVVGLMGENGAGKSTLMKVLCGVYTHQTGTIRFKGQEIRFDSPLDAFHAGIAVIHQELNLIPDMSIAENMFLGREPRSRFGCVDFKRMNALASALLADVQCPHPPSALVRDLSVGNQQLVEIAKALSFEADLIIMDEPTSAISSEEVARLFGIIQKLKAVGKSIVYISHKMEEIFKITDRVVVMRDGRYVGESATSAIDETGIIRMMVGRELSELFPSQGEKTPGDEQIRVERLCRTLPHLALRDISFYARRGEIVGFFGLMGAGRSELLETLFGAHGAPDSGTVQLAGNPVTIRHVPEALAHGMALVTEDRKARGIVPDMSVGRNITLTHLSRLFPSGLLNLTHENEIADARIARHQVATTEHSKAIRLLSGGNQQKALLGRALLPEPTLVLLDEPTRGIDVAAKAEIYKLIRALADSGKAVLLVTSELPELLGLADRLYVLSEGRLTYGCERREATEHQLMTYALPRGDA